MIYFIRMGSNGPIKIGFSVEPKRRLRQLQTASPTRLLLLAVVPGELTDELAIHRRLRRYRGEGEWFENGAEVLSLLAELEDVEYEVLDDRAYAVLRRTDSADATHTCAFCGRTHKHGQGDGHRIAHCVRTIRSEVQAADGTILNVKDGYIVKTGTRADRSASE